MKQIFSREPSEWRSQKERERGAARARVEELLAQANRMTEGLATPSAAIITAEEQDEETCAQVLVEGHKREAIMSARASTDGLIRDLRRDIFYAERTPFCARCGRNRQLLVRRYSVPEDQQSTRVTVTAYWVCERKKS